MGRFPLATIAILFLMIPALAACRGDGGGGPSATDDPSTPGASAGQETPSPTPYPLPTLTPFPSHLEQQIEQIKERVAQVRGLPVPILQRQGLLSVETLRESSLEELAGISEEDAQEAEASEQLMQMLGVVPDGYSLEDLTSDFSENIAGFYSIEEDAFVVVGEPSDELTPSQELTIAHELTHAMQDDTFDLQEFQDRYEDFEQDEEGFTAYGNLTSCVLEGDARFTEFKYSEERWGSDWLDVLQESFDEEEEQEPRAELPPFIQDEFIFNYSQCYTFVEAVYEDGGWQAINDLYENPPATQEQVLDFEKFQAHEVASRGAPAGLEDRLPGWTEAEGSSQFGEFDAGAYIRALSDDDSFVGALYGYFGSIGWESGWLRHYQDETGDRHLVQIALSFESDEDRDSFLGVFAPIAAGFGADIEVPDIPNILDFDSDSPPPIKAGDTISWSHGPSAGPFGLITVDASDRSLDIFIATDQDTLSMVTPS